MDGGSTNTAEPRIDNCLGVKLVREVSSCQAKNRETVGNCEYTAGENKHKLFAK